MLTIFYADGSKQVVKLTKDFFKPTQKGDPTIQAKCEGWQHDLGGVAYKLDYMN